MATKKNYTQVVNEDKFKKLEDYHAEHPVEEKKETTFDDFLDIVAKNDDTTVVSVRISPAIVVAIDALLANRKNTIKKQTKREFYETSFLSVLKEDWDEVKWDDLKRADLKGINK